jgi:hypothetical protein
MRELGQQGTVSLAAAMNVVVAAGGLVAQRRASLTAVLDKAR